MIDGKLDRKLSTFLKTTKTLQDHIGELHQELQQRSRTVSFSSLLLAQKKTEMKSLNTQLHSI